MAEEVTAVDAAGLPIERADIVDRGRIDLETRPRVVRLARDAIDCWRSGPSLDRTDVGESAATIQRTAEVGRVESDRDAAIGGSLEDAVDDRATIPVPPVGLVDQHHPDPTDVGRNGAVAARVHLGIDPVVREQRRGRDEVAVDVTGETACRFEIEQSSPVGRDLVPTCLSHQFHRVGDVVGSESAYVHDAHPEPPASLAFSVAGASLASSRSRVIRS
jgi:hypothetical protein